MQLDNLPHELFDFLDLSLNQVSGLLFAFMFWLVYLSSFWINTKNMSNFWDFFLAILYIMNYIMNFEEPATVLLGIYAVDPLTLLTPRWWGQAYVGTKPFAGLYLKLLGVFNFGFVQLYKHKIWFEVSVKVKLVELVHGAPVCFNQTLTSS